MSKSESPDKEEVKAAREETQAALGLRITDAQDWCAESVCSTRRAWQQWEHGDRKMHPAFWELFQVKKSMINVRN